MEQRRIQKKKKKKKKKYFFFLFFFFLSFRSSFLFFLLLLHIYLFTEFSLHNKKEYSILPCSNMRSRTRVVKKDLWESSRSSTSARISSAGRVCCAMTTPRPPQKWGIYSSKKNKKTKKNRKKKKKKKKKFKRMQTPN